MRLGAIIFPHLPATASEILLRWKLGAGPTVLIFRLGLISSGPPILAVSLLTIGLVPHLLVFLACVPLLLSWCPKGSDENVILENLSNTPLQRRFAIDVSRPTVHVHSLASSFLFDYSLPFRFGVV